MICNLCGLNSEDNSDRISLEYIPNGDLPEPLPVTVTVGLFIEGGGPPGDGAVRSLDTALHRITSLLSHTPHTFRFVLPVTYGTEEEIVQRILSCDFWKERSPPELQFFRRKDDERIQNEPLLESIPYEMSEIIPGIKTYGYDPVSTAITGYSSLVIIIGRGPGPSGTNDKNSYTLARHYGRSVVSIDGLTGRIEEIPSSDDIFYSYTQIDFYNSRNVEPAKFFAEKKRYITILENDLRIAGFDEDSITFSFESLMPHYIKVKGLARRYHFLYALKGIMVALLSALAIFIITIQTLFFPENSGLIWTEVSIIGIIISIMVAAKIGDYHIKSIDYSFLAERIRTAFYTRIVCISCLTTDTLPLMIPVRTQNDWMVMAFETIVSSGRMMACRKEIPLEPLRKFIISGWIGKRLKYYEKEAKKAGFRYNVLTNFAVLLFVVTMILAIAHALGIGHREMVFHVGLPLIIAFFTITIPAFGAAVSAIRVHREYHRNSERYSQIIRHLTAIITEMEYAADVGELCSLIQKMNEITFREENEWKMVSRCIDTE